MRSFTGPPPRPPQAPAQGPVAFVCHAHLLPAETTPGPFFVFQVLTFLKLLANLTFLLTEKLIIAPISESSQCEGN